MEQINESDAILAWHFVGDKLRDGRPVPEDGETLVHDGPLKMCQSGLHASRDPFDALQYAPGAILCQVQCWGKVVEEADKLVCTHRRIIARRDATDGIRYFARMRALSVLHLWDAPDVVLDFLMTGDAAYAACTAARAANYAAADAANYAAAYAARAAAETAAYAAYAAAYTAADMAARAAGYAACTAAYAAARTAAYAAARAAACTAARDDWNTLVYETFGVQI